MGLAGVGDLAAQLLGEAYHLGHQLTVGGGLVALAQVDVVLKPTRTLPPITMPAAAMSQALRPMPVTVQVEPEGICLTK